LAFTGLNYLAIVIATILGFGVGALWYMLFAKPWMAALGKTEAEIRANNAPTPYITAVVGNFILAIILAAVLKSLGAPLTVAGAVAIGFLLWLGFIVTTMAVNNAFGGRKTTLTAIDAGHWLAVVIVMSIVIALLG
jgi:hypothetical protein